MNGSIRAAAAALWILVCVVSFTVPVSAQSSGWSSVDVGSPQLAGSASQSGTGFTVAAAGADVWDTRDEFHFMYQRLAGDFDLQTKVDTLAAAHWWAKAGVMVRNSLEADAAHGFVLVSAGSGTAFQRRRTTGGASVHSDGPFAGAPYWVKVTRRGTSLSAYASSNGSSWTLVGSDTIALGETVYAGVAVTSHDVSARATAAFSGLVLSSIAVPAGMSNADVGSPAIAGSVQHAAGAYTITGAGTDIWDNADQFHFVYQAVTGDFDVRGRVNSLENTDTWAKAGVMIRESLAAGSKHALAAVTGGAGFAFQRRTEANGPSEHTDGGWTTSPGWVRLVRQGASVEAFHSADGTAWRSMGSIPMALANTVLVGMAVTSHNPGQATVARMDQVTITPTAPASGGLTGTDIGAPALAGSVSYAGGVYTVGAAGRDIWGTEDQFHFVYQQISGDVDVRARVGSLQHTDAWAKAGVMIRSSLAAGSAHAFVALTPEYGFAFQRRTAMSGESTHTSGGDGALPGWVRLTRIGTTFEAYRSQDGVTWTSIGRDTIPMGQVIYVGLAVTSHHESQRTTATFSGLTAAPAASSAPSPDPQPLPAPRFVAFTASADHAVVTRYELEIFASGSTPGTATPVAALNLGKPAPSGGEITVDCSAFFAGLASGNYQATVTAIGSSGSSRSAAVAFSR